MTLIVIVILVAVLAAVALWLKSQQGTGDSEQWPFYPKNPLTDREVAMFHKIQKALPDHIVLAQVQLSRVLGVKKGNKFHEWNNRINRMSLDIVICDRAGKLKCAIELDDSSHAREDRQIADKKKNKALADAGVKLLRWEPKFQPTVEEIRKLVGD